MAIGQPPLHIGQLSQLQRKAHLGGRSRRRAGYIYLAVLFTALIVVAAVGAALAMSTASLRAENDRGSRHRALRLAESELARQAVIVRNSTQWRSDSASGVFSAWYPMTVDGVNVTGSSQVRHRFTDVDGDLNDGDADTVELTVHAKVGRSEAAVVATLESDPGAFDVLRYSVTTSGDLELESGGTLSCENAVQVSDDCKTSSSGILTAPRLECDGSIQTTLRGDLGGESVTLPNRNLLDEYSAVGTQISSASLPTQSGDLLLQDIVLSPTVNPYGTVDSAGIYWIDAQGSGVQISHCRLDATLCIQDASVIRISGGICWSFPTNPDAILISDSPIRMINVEASLDEAARGTNFNPAISPYRQNWSNATSTDVYPTELRGLIYTTDNMRVEPLVDNKILPVTGSIVAVDLRVEGYMMVRQLDELVTDPPSRLSNPSRMRFVRGTQRRIPSP